MKGYVNGIDWINAEAMKYWSYPSGTAPEKRNQEIHNMIFSGDYYGARKCDGYYERLIKDEDGNCFMVARSKNVKGEATEKLAWVPQIHDFMESLPKGTVLLSECWLPDKEGSKQITSLLGCLKDKCIARQQKDGMLHFYIFDVMCYDLIDFTEMKAIERFEKLHEISHAYRHPYVEYAQYYNGKELWDRLQRGLACGEEGVVITHKDCPVYFKRTPARKTVKIKKELQETIDCFFTGRITPPSKPYQGKEIESWQYWVDIESDERIPVGVHYYEVYHENKPWMAVTKPYYLGYAGSLEIGLMDGDKVVGIGYLSGLTDEIKMHHQEYKYRVIEVGAMELNDTGGLRHGKMIGWRPDKNWRECDISQLKEI